jgi:hypothetical protein
MGTLDISEYTDSSHGNPIEPPIAHSATDCCVVQPARRPNVRAGIGLAIMAANSTYLPDLGRNGNDNTRSGKSLS